MSAHTGDKARFNNNRKRKAARKLALKDLRATMITPATAPADKATK